MPKEKIVKLREDIHQLLKLRASKNSSTMKQELVNILEEELKDEAKFLNEVKKRE